MDPYTTTLAFLLTPPGQEIATFLIELDVKFIHIIGDFISKIHLDLHPQVPVQITPIPIVDGK